MMKRTLAMLVVVSAVGIALPRQASRVAISPVGLPTTPRPRCRCEARKSLTVAIDSRTISTKLIAQKPWQEDTRLNRAR